MAINKLPDILDEKEKEYLGIVINGYNNYRKARGWTQLSLVDLLDYENYKFTLISKIEQKYHTLHN